MKVNISNATFSSIVGIGQKVKKASKESGEEYLELNRGVNAVTEIDLSKIFPLINYNSKEFQVYAPNLGIESFRRAIAQEYFPTFYRNDDIINKIAITPGGMPALDLVIQILNVENIYFPNFYWGSYSKMATIRKKRFSFYESLEDLDTSKLNDSSCVFICDPNNPTGIKLDDDFLYDHIYRISKSGAIVVFDCPYRKLFFDDRMFNLLSELDNVIITESFSKWVGLSGLRMGFIYCNNKDFNAELNIRLLYEFNAVSSASQIFIEKILTTQEGRLALKNFQEITTENIAKNIDYLKARNLLVQEIYKDKNPLGIFAVINKSEDYLFQHKIGAVGLDKFVYHDKDIWSSYARICVSVPHEKFKKFLDKI
jgi:aspartate/methionine/tyrosine aminotransferase